MQVGVDREFGVVDGRMWQVDGLEFIMEGNAGSCG